MKVQNPRFYLHLFPLSWEVMEAEGQANTVHTNITQIVLNMVEQRWRGRWRNAGQGKELFWKRRCAFIWIWNQLERRGAISSSVLRELFIRMTFTVKGEGGVRGAERDKERERQRNFFEEYGWRVSTGTQSHDMKVKQMSKLRRKYVEIYIFGPQKWHANNMRCGQCDLICNP